MSRPLSFIIILLMILLAGAALLSVSGCSKAPAASDAGLFSPVSPSAPATPKAVRIGALLPLTGPDAKLGETFRSSIELALEMENGVVAGHPVKLVIEDEGDPDSGIAIEKVVKLVQSDKVDIILGPYRDDSSLSVTSLTNSVPIINVKWSPLGYSQIAIRNKYTFWTSQLNQSSAYPLGLYAYEAGIRSVAALSTDDAAANDYIQGFIDGFRSASGKVVLQQKAPHTETDFAPYLDNVKSVLANVKTVKACVFAVSGDAAKTTLFKQYAEAGLSPDVPVFIPEINGITPSLMQKIGDNIIGVSVIEKYVPELDNEENRRFLTAYRKNFKTDPDNQACDAYNAMRVILETIKITKGNVYPDVLGPILRATEAELPTGHFRFSINRTGIQPVRVGEVVKADGKLAVEIKKEYPPDEYYWVPYP